MVDDGRSSFGGYDWNFIDFERICRLECDLHECDFGSDEEHGTHRLLLHRPTRKLYAVTNDQAQRVSEAQ